jgi:hypothetical protein
MTLRTKFFLLLLMTALLASGMACKLANVLPKPTPIPVTTQSVELLTTQVVQAAATAASGGPLVLEFTEEQLTSAATLELQKQADLGVSNVQVLLRDDVMKITGDVEQSGFNLPLTIGVKVTADGQGKLQTQIVEAAIGPVSLPENLTAQISAQLSDMLLTKMAENGQGYYVDSISIANGKLTLVAHKR